MLRWAEKYNYNVNVHCFNKEITKMLQDYMKKNVICTESCEIPVSHKNHKNKSWSIKHFFFLKIICVCIGNKELAC